MRRTGLERSDGCVPNELQYRAPSLACVYGEVSLVVETSSAHIIAPVIALKTEVELKLHASLKITIICRLEAHPLAKELGAVNASAIPSLMRPFLNYWEERRM